MYQNMEYPMEELIMLVGNLADKYTSKSSSSVTYETAQTLMEAVLYCLEEYRREYMEELEYAGTEEGHSGGFRADRWKTERDTPEAGSAGVQLRTAGEAALPLKEAYEKGYQLVLKKTEMARQLYHKILQNFEDYGCRNYSSTIKQGMPEFFRRYDARFRPQDHLLTLDYPVLQPPGNLCGVDAIYCYLQNIRLESRFLSAFPSSAVERLLAEIQPEYQDLYLDNICGAVLERALLCMLAERPVGQLYLEEEDLAAALEYFQPSDSITGKSSGDYPHTDNKRRNQITSQAETRLHVLINKLADHVFPGNELLKEYLTSQSREYSVRIIQRLTTA